MTFDQKDDTKTKAQLSIMELAERHWDGEGDLIREHHPVGPVGTRAGEEIMPGLLYLKCTSSVSAIDTSDGLVLLDTGGRSDTDDVFHAVRTWRPKVPLRAAIFSHHHLDHVFGMRNFDDEAHQLKRIRPTVYGHELIPVNFNRLVRNEGRNTLINQRQFARQPGTSTLRMDLRYPDIIYRDALSFRVGDLTFELHHALGGSDDATWTWVPERRLLHAGDMFVWAVPNAGNPQKVQRYLSEWATALGQMAALNAELMIPGHGLPILGSDRIRTALLDTAEFLNTVEDQTLALMNQGKSLDHVLHEVKIPSYLTDKPYLRAVYDHPQFLIRNVWRRYGGWYDGEPDNLLPAPRVQQATEWIKLAGGVDAVLARAKTLADAGDHRMACHLIEFAILAEPGMPEVHEVRQQVYAARALVCQSSMARNILNHAAESSAQGVRDLAGNF